jgi:hypothetical protein
LLKFVNTRVDPKLRNLVGFIENQCYVNLIENDFRDL